MRKLIISNEDRESILSLHETYKKQQRNISEQKRPEDISNQLKKIKPEPGCDYMFDVNGPHDYFAFLYKVKPGETLESIAQKHSPISIETIKKINPKIKGDMLKAGCVIKLEYPMGD